MTPQATAASNKTAAATRGDTRFLDIEADDTLTLFRLTASGICGRWRPSRSPVTSGRLLTVRQRVTREWSHLRIGACRHNPGSVVLHRLSGFPKMILVHEIVTATYHQQYHDNNHGS